MAGATVSPSPATSILRLIHLSEVKLGLVPALISKYLIREWGPSISRHAMLTVSPMSPLTLHNSGAILSLHPTLAAASSAADDVARSLLQGASHALDTAKRIVRVGHEWKEERQRAFLAAEVGEVGV